MSTLLPFANHRFCRSCLFVVKATAWNFRLMSNVPPRAHDSNVEGSLHAAASGGGPDRFGLDKTKGVNDLCRRDARIRAQKEAAAVDEFSRRFEECSLEDQPSLAAQRHFALQVLLAGLHAIVFSHCYSRKLNLATASTIFVDNAG